METTDGALVLIVGVITIGLIQVGLRPAWMGAGFLVALLGRQVFADVGPGDPTVWLIGGLALALLAALVLVGDMVRDVTPSTGGVVNK